MKRLLLLAAVAALVAGPAHAGIPLAQIPAQGAAAYVQLPDGTFLPSKGDANGNPGPAPIPTGTFTPVTVSSTAIGFTPPANSTWCILSIETNSVRWRDDGTNPTASIGVPMVAGEKILYTASLSAIKFIRQSADASLQGACYK